MDQLPEDNGQEQPVQDAQQRQGADRRQSVVDRRSELERRQTSAEEAAYEGPER